jgi:hypothetical protein
LVRILRIKRFKTRTPKGLDPKELYYYQLLKGANNMPKLKTNVHKEALKCGAPACSNKEPRVKVGLSCEMYSTGEPNEFVSTKVFIRISCNYCNRPLLDGTPETLSIIGLEPYLVGV